MAHRYRLEFKDYHGKRHKIAEFETETYEEASQIAIRTIYKEQKSVGYKVYYIRSWLHESESVFDYGSHSEFYYMREIDTK